MSMQGVAINQPYLKCDGVGCTSSFTATEDGGRFGGLALRRAAESFGWVGDTEHDRDYCAAHRDQRNEPPKDASQCAS
jgi:hypothetical protein